MISSPCSDCPKRDEPKDECSRSCRKIKLIQEINNSVGIFGFHSGIDYSEEGRYSINFPVRKGGG
jgi:hypothetical protein